MANQNNKWFTLIELLVWISISTILMISVWYLITWWIKNITNQEKVLQNSRDISDFQNKLNTIFSNIDTSFIPIKTASWVIVKIKQNYDEWWFAYIWETSQDKFYCLSWSENTQTNHIFIKTFIPFWTNFTDSKSHKIDWIWRNIFWCSEITKNWLEANKIYINNPTWITSSWGLNFISDTLNNRILYKSGTKIYELLNGEDWLSEPTDLKIINSDLYIANSWNWEILKYSSKNIPTPNLTLTWITNKIINSFSIKFFNQNWDKNINSPILKSYFTFTNYTKQDWDSISISNSKLTYSFSGWIDKVFSWDITISNLTDFTWTWTYYVKLDINNKFYKYFTQWDDNLLTKDDNTLESLVKDSKYYIKINNDSNFENYSPNSNNLSYNKNYDYILRNPIKSLDKNYNFANKLLNLELDYYNKYNCYNLEEKSSKSLILKKNYK